MMKQKGILVIICLVLCLLVPGVYANTVSITPANVQHQIGETHSFTVILDSAPEGLSGFNITLSVQNPAVAQIIGVSFNTTWASMPVNSSLPASSIWCKAVDLTGNSGTVNITLVTIFVRADSVGTTNITINPERVEDRIGGRYSPSVIPATLTCINVTDRPGNIGVFRNSTHLFYLDYNGNGAWNGAGIDKQYNFGISGDIPITGDWNNDGKTEIGVFRPSTHLFYLDYDGNGAWNGALVDRSFNFGISGDIPVTGDWNSDGKTEIGVFRNSTHLFYLDYNGNGMWNGASVDRQYNFGISGDIPITGDWNNDGKSEIGVFRNSTHLFYLDYNGNGVWNGASVDWQYNFGISGDIPVTGDWNSDARTEIGVFRPSTHLFYLDYNGNGAWNGASVDRSYNFGITGDKPITGKW